MNGWDVKERHCGTLTEPFVLHAYTREDLFWALSVDGSGNGGRPIDREFDLPKLATDGHTHTDQHLMRRSIIMRECEHHRTLRRHYPGAREFACIGNGNLLANFGFVAWSAGLPFHLHAEPVFSSCYTAVACWKGGRVSVEEVWFAKENNSVRVERKRASGAEDITTDIDFVTTGQPIIRAGMAIPLDHIAELFYDKRHVITPIRLPLGATSLFLPNTQLQEGLARKAVTGPVRISLEAQIDEETTLPLSVKRWVDLAGTNPDALDVAGHFLKQHGERPKVGG